MRGGLGVGGGGRSGEVGRREWPERGEEGVERGGGGSAEGGGGSGGGRREWRGGEEGVERGEYPSFHTHFCPPLRLERGEDHSTGSAVPSENRDKAVQQL